MMTLNNPESKNDKAREGERDTSMVKKRELEVRRILKLGSLRLLNEEENKEGERGGKRRW